MTHPHPAGLGFRPSDPALHRPARAGSAPPRAEPTRRADTLMRRYHVSHLDPVSDECIDQVKIAPAIPAFELAFAAMARGSLLAGPEGPVAIEDLRPGMWLETVGKGACRVQWIGMMTFVPHLPHHGDSIDALLRITADSFGVGRPMPDLLLGPGARLMRTRPGREGAVLQPVPELVDGESVLRVVPPAPVSLYHVGFADQRILCVNGLEIASFLPGQEPQPAPGGEMLACYRGLFPHIRHRDAPVGASAATSRGPVAQDDREWMEPA